MIRILLPLAMVASLYFTPLFVETTSGGLTGTNEAEVSGRFFLDGMVGCLAELRVPIGEGCSFDKTFNDSPLVGHVVNWAALLALAAGALSVIGLLPVVGRLTSIVVLLAGLGGLGAMGLMALTLMGSDGGLGAIRWGTYLTTGAALLTVISGLGGMRGAR